jgi:hypothetical protein
MMCVLCVQNLTQEDSYGLVYSMFEISLPVLQPRQQQQPPGLRLDVTLPFITQPLADRGLGQLAKVGAPEYQRGDIPVGASSAFAGRSTTGAVLQVTGTLWLPAWCI